MTHALYRVVGTRNYRGKEPGTEFVGRIDPVAEQRAVDRGAIIVVERVTPKLPDRYEFPAGWIGDAK